MKVGVLQFFGWRDRSVPLEDVYTRALDRIEVMDRTGYDAVWLAEHHFSGYSVCPSVHVMGAHVAGRTQNLRIGMAVTLAAFYHPLRIAEEIALLDVLTGTLLGRHALRLVVLNFLVGRFRNRIRFVPPWQQALAVGALLLNDRIVHLWIVGLLERTWPGWAFWLPPLVGVALWPWLFLLLDALRSRRRGARA